MKGLPLIWSGWWNGGDAQMQHTGTKPVDALRLRVLFVFYGIQLASRPLTADGNAADLSLPLLQLPV